MIDLTSGAEISLDNSHSASAETVGLTSPIPPIFTGRERRSRSSSEHGGHPVIGGISLRWILSSNRWRR